MDTVVLLQRTAISIKGVRVDVRYQTVLLCLALLLAGTLHLAHLPCRLSLP